MTAIKLLKPHKGGQRALYLHPARFHVVACGRRWGKTEFGKLVIRETMFRYGLDAWWVSPTYKMSSDIWREFKNEMKSFATRVNGADRRIEMANGTALTIWTGSQYDTMRGGAPGVVVVDEAAMIPNGQDMWHAAIQPALTDAHASHGLGNALFLSTPRGRNWFWDLFRLGADPLVSEYKSWQFPSWFNPKWTKAYFEELKLTVPEMFWDQEYAAVFLDDAGAVFRHVVDAALGEYLEPYQGNFVMGIDWGRKQDFTVITVWDIDKQKMVDMDRFNQIGWAFQRGRVVNLAKKWRPLHIKVEENAVGEAQLEELQRDEDLSFATVSGFATTGQSKPQLIENFALAIERGDVILLNDRVLVGELQAYEMNRTGAGNWRFEAPSGQHDDCVIAAAIGYHAMQDRRSHIAVANVSTKMTTNTGRQGYGGRRR